MIRQIRSIPRYCQSQVLLIHSPSSFSPIFLLFSLLDRFQMNLNYIIILSNALSCPFNIGDPMRRSCIPFFLLFCLMLLDWSSFGDFSSDISLLAHLTGVSALIQRFGWDDQYCYFIVPVSYWFTVRTQSCRWWSLCLTFTLNRSRLVVLLDFGLGSLLFLVNNGSNKPIKYWLSLYVVGITWGEVKVCLL